MYANDGSRAFVVRVAGSRNEKSNLYVKGRSETPARSHRRTEQRDIATVQCRFRRARQLSAMLRTQTCQNKMTIDTPQTRTCKRVRYLSARLVRELEHRDHFNAQTVDGSSG